MTDEVSITFTNGIIEGFSPRFKSISKDCDRYFDALVDLSEEGVIQVDEVLKFSSSGYLWIYFQYIEMGYIDAIEADLIKDVTDRDFYGSLFENTRSVLNYLIKLSEYDRVIRVYKAAISHRMKAIKSEYSISINPKKRTDAQNASKKWLKHYLPYFQGLVSDYEIFLTNMERPDQDVLDYKNLIQSLRGSLNR